MHSFPAMVGCMSNIQEVNFLKKLLILWIVLSVLLTFCACQARDGTSSAPKPVPVPTAEIPSESEEIPEPQYVEPSSAASQSDELDWLPGEYIAQDPDLEVQYRPVLTLAQNGTFVLTVNLFSAMGEITGTYTTNGVELQLQVETLNYEGFAGDDVREIKFDIVSDHSLMYRSNNSDQEQALGTMQPYDLLEKDLSVS